MKKTIFTFTGDKPGPTITVLAGVHGNEVCGVKMFNKVLPTLKIKRGRLYCIYANPEAIEKGQRMVSYDLNRIFLPSDQLPAKALKSSEYQRAQKITSFLEKSDALLDIHSTSEANTEPFIICDEKSNSVARYLPATLRCSGFSTLQAGSTDAFMNKKGKIGVCIECGEHSSPSSSSLSEQAFFNFLSYYRMIDSPISKLTAQKKVKVVNVYKSRGIFTPAKIFRNFEAIKKGQLIGEDGGSEVYCKEDGFILFAQATKKTGEEAFLTGKF